MIGINKFSNAYMALTKTKRQKEQKKKRKVRKTLVKMQKKLFTYWET